MYLQKSHIYLFLRKVLKLLNLEFGILFSFSQVMLSKDINAMYKRQAVEYDLLSGKSENFVLMQEQYYESLVLLVTFSGGLVYRDFKNCYLTVPVS